MYNTYFYQGAFTGIYNEKNINKKVALTKETK